ncbi:MAG TPA: hypothetical protein VFQ30_05745 [Ktedonobacteraceae bacterium]|nr:hypothetical protein [Ktedonobacteraceae bacterium]
MAIVSPLSYLPDTVETDVDTDLSSAPPIYRPVERADKSAPTWGLRPHYFVKQIRQISLKFF